MFVIIMDNCLKLDNIKKFKQLINKDKANLKLYYSKACQYCSNKILEYIVTELNYIEDYVKLKSKVNHCNLKIIKDYLTENENNSNYFEKYIKSLINTNNYNEFIELDNDIQISSDNIIYMCKKKRIDFLKFTYLNLNVCKKNLIFNVIDYDLDFLVRFFISKKYDFTEELHHMPKDYCLCFFHDFALYKKKQHIFKSIVESTEIKFSMIYKFKYYSEENIHFFIDHLKIEKNQYYSGIIFRVLKWCQNYDYIKILDKLLLKFPDLFNLNLSKKLNNYRFPNREDIYECIISSKIKNFDVFDYIHDYANKKNIIINFDVYFPFLFLAYDCEFLIQFIKRYKIKLNEVISDDYYFLDVFTHSKFDIFLDVDHDDYLKNYNFIDDFIEKLKFLKNIYNFDLNKFKEVHILYHFRSYLYIVSDDKIFECCQKIINFLNENEESFDFQNYAFKLFMHFLNFNMLSSYFLDKCDINSITFTKDMAKNITSNEYQLFLSIKNKLTPENYKLFINLIDFKIIKKNITSFEIFQDLVNDGLDIKNLERDTSSKWYSPYFENDVLKIIDLALKEGYMYIDDDFETFISDNDYTDYNIISYFQYLKNKNLDNIFILACKYQRYSLIQHLIKLGQKLSFKIIKKYDLDYNKFIWAEDIEGELFCVICYTNSPNILFLPCGHLISCAQCSINMKKECPYDHIPIDKYVVLKGNTEDERLNCVKCKTNKVQKIYTKCQHSTCDKCSIKSKCPVCFKRSLSKKIYLI